MEQRIDRENICNNAREQCAAVFVGLLGCARMGVGSEGLCARWVKDSCMRQAAVNYMLMKYHQSTMELRSFDESEVMQSLSDGRPVLLLTVWSLVGRRAAVESTLNT